MPPTPMPEEWVVEKLSKSIVMTKPTDNDAKRKDACAPSEEELHNSAMLLIRVLLARIREAQKERDTGSHTIH